MDNVILAGPWVGEFGWELFCWQGYLRKLSENNKIIVVSRESREFLYRDFCSTFIPFDPDCKETDAYKCHDFDGDIKESIEKTYIFDEYLDPRNGVVYFSNEKEDKCKNFFDQKFKRYGYIGDGFDVIVHARNTDKCGAQFRNWDIGKWHKLVHRLREEGKYIACIGSSDSCFKIDGVVDLIDCSLEVLAEAMANSRIILGPSSGPMHYAALCGLPQVVWGEPKNLNKYLKSWNPFDLKVTYYSKDWWNPSVETVLELIHNHLGEKQ